MTASGAVTNGRPGHETIILTLVRVQNLQVAEKNDRQIAGHNRPSAPKMPGIW
jgi:hypothetical protein